MADSTPALRIPEGAIPIVRDAFAAGVLYTVPAGRRLRITGVWVSIGQPAAGAAAGSANIVANTLVSDPNPRTLGAASVGTSIAANSVAFSCLDIPVPAAGIVSLTLTGAAGSSIAGGFHGYEYAPLANEV